MTISYLIWYFLSMNQDQSNALGTFPHSTHITNSSNACCNNLFTYVCKCICAWKTCGGGVKILSGNGKNVVQA